MRARAARRSAILLLLAVLAGAGCQGGATPPPAPAALEDPWLRHVRQLTFAGRRTGEGYFGPDGRQMVFQSEREPGNPFYQIYLMDLAGGRVSRVSPGVGKTTCAWIHPSGARVLFSSTHLDPESEALQEQELIARAHGQQRRYAWDYDPHFDLFTVRLPLEADPEPRRLDDAFGYDAEASWSPDGRTIVFASNRHAYGPDGEPAPGVDPEHLALDPSYYIDLYAMDSNGRNVRRLTETPGYDGGPFFSPDGLRVVWRRFSEDGATAEIFSMDARGGDERQLTRLAAMSWAPYYHPSGDYVIFATNRHGFENFELYLVDVEGSRAPVRVTDSDGFDGLPVFTPDGQRLVWTSNRAGRGSQLFAGRWNDALARERLGLPARELRGVGPLLPVPAELSPEIEPADVRAHVEALASDVTEGRLTGSPGAKIATGYVARVFRSLGLEPDGDGSGYFESFGFTAGVSLGDGNSLASSAPPTGPEHAFALDVEWRPLSFSKVGEIAPAKVVFAGYGLVVPERGSLPAIDDYADLDVTDRWVLVLRYVPEELETDERRHQQRYASLRYKAMVARDRGAKGILFASGPQSQVREELVPLRFDASMAGSSIAAVSVSDAAADRLLAPSGRTLAYLQSELDRGTRLSGFELETRVEARIDIQQQRKEGRNVLARLPAALPPGPASGHGGDGQAAKPLPAIVIGAHVDHLGRGQGSTSLARDAEAGAIHPGADDNASGVAGLLEIAQQLAHRRALGTLETRRDVVFAAWSGEELGLLGSSHHVSERAQQASEAAGHGAGGAAHGGDLSGRVAAYLNLDMVGRAEGAVSLFGVDSSPVWPAQVERHNVPLGLAVELHGDSYLPTDATPFYLNRTPILSAFTGAHEDYHSPRDVAERVDYEGAARIASLMGAIAESLAGDEEAPTYVATKAPERGMPRSGLRVYLGTIPDYARSDVTGLAISGVTEGGPADEAGLRAGDIVVEVDGRTIENIYDYTYALDELRIGEETELVVERGGERVTLQITPGSRQ